MSLLADNSISAPMRTDLGVRRTLQCWEKALGGTIVQFSQRMLTQHQGRASAPAGSPPDAARARLARFWPARTWGDGKLSTNLVRLGEPVLQSHAPELLRCATAHSLRLFVQHVPPRGRGLVVVDIVKKYIPPPRQLVRARHVSGYLV